MTPEQIQKLIAEAIKEHLRVVVELDHHVISDKPQVVVYITWDEQTISSDYTTIEEVS